MADKTSKSREGFTLVEVMLAVAVTVVVALGTLCYQYYGVQHSRAADAQVTGTRVGQLVLEDWKSTGGDQDYDPAALGLGFTTTSPENYIITLDNQTFYVQLVRNDIDQDTVAGVTLREIKVLVRWRKDYARGAISGSDPLINLTTYVRRDG
jgi:prepilin-type N-terminal cleavage/methylation domain-containing protein